MALNVSVRLLKPAGRVYNAVKTTSSNKAVSNVENVNVLAHPRNRDRLSYHNGNYAFLYVSMSNK